VKRAAFRLQPVLELRRTQERAAAVAAAQAAQTAADADRRATAQEQAVAAAVVPRTSTAGAFLATMTRLRMAALDASESRALATAQAEQAELVRVRWTQAAQRTKGMERLRDRHVDALRRAELVAEERLVDDIVTGRAARTQPEETLAVEPQPGPGEVPWTE
jgi:flagellar export protein FliJ